MEKFVLYSIQLIQLKLLRLMENVGSFNSSFIIRININNTKMYITRLILEIPSSVVPNHK